MKSSNSKMVDLQIILNSPLLTRCTDLSRIIKETYFKELSNVFPIILESLYGFGSCQVGSHWNIDTIRQSCQPQEYEAVRAFLAPRGPLLTLCYKLTIDRVTNYEFDLRKLPLHTRQLISDGIVPAFYSNKLKSDCQNPGSAPVSVVLNAFELYMFHFAHHVVNPANDQLGMLWSKPEDFLFPRLLDDYLRFFLPIDGMEVPSLQDMCDLLSVSYQTGQAPLSSTPMHSPQSLRSSQAAFGLSPLQVTSPQRNQTLLKNLLPSPSVVASQTPVNPLLNRQENWRHHGEVWCSETFVQILVEFWLNQVPLSSNQELFNLNVEQKYVPRADHVHMIRTLIKHSHFFSNQLRHCTQTSFNNLPHSALDSLRKNMYANVIQKKLYCFLRYSFNHWPLDASFRVLLELWLSVIQPWRYVSNETWSPTSSPDDKKQRAVDTKWKKFIAENLLFYSRIFHQMVPRFLRMDLSTAENAYMLYRVLHVFSQPNLSKMISEVEQYLFDSPVSSGGNQDSPSNAMLGVAGRQSIAEFEGHSHKYRSFKEDVDHSIVPTLMNTMVQVIMSSKRMMTNLNKKSENFWLSFFSALGGNSQSVEEEYIIKNSLKVEQYLSSALTNLSEIFQMPEPCLEVNQQNIMNDNANVPSTSELPNDTIPFEKHEDSLLTVHEKLRLLNGVGEPKNLGYRGNPDLQPIRSFECAFLVRQLHVFSCLINARFGDSISNLYYRRNDYPSRILKCFFSPPSTYWTSDKSYRHSENLPPRICLRVLADYQVLGYLLLWYLITNIFGYGIFSFFFSILIILFMYASFKTLVA